MFHPCPRKDCVYNSSTGCSFYVGDLYYSICIDTGANYTPEKDFYPDCNNKSCSFYSHGHCLKFEKEKCPHYSGNKNDNIFNVPEISW